MARTNSGNGKIDPETLERIRISLECHGLDHLDTAQMLGMRASELVAVAKKHGIRRRPGRQISDLNKQWAELEYRLPDGESERTKTLAAINAWLARRERRTGSRSRKTG
jgi:hypothetical protein